VQEALVKQQPLNFIVEEALKKKQPWFSIYEGR
jgi:hypothetical protein